MRIKIREEIRRVKPFDTDREKVEYFEKLPGSVFSGLTMERINIFLDRNKRNFMRSYPYKNQK